MLHCNLVLPVFQPISPYDQAGPGFYYLLRILRVGAQSETDTLEIPINDWKTNRYELSTGYVYEPYKITLRAGNSVGEASADPSTIIGYSYESSKSLFFLRYVMGSLSVNG